MASNFTTSLIGSLFKETLSLGWGITKTAASAAFSPSPYTRGVNTGFMMGIGAVAGGTATAFADDTNNPTLRVQNILRGAAAGAGVTFGAATVLGIGRMGFRGLSLAAKMKDESRWTTAGRTAFNAAGRFYGAGKTLGSMGLSTATLALKHPIGLAAAGAGIYGAAYATRLAGPSSPTLRGANVNTQYDRQAIAAEGFNEGQIAPSGVVGTMPMMARPMQRALEQSTEGLTQGLHRGRHG